MGPMSFVDYVESIVRLYVKSIANSYKNQCVFSSKYKVSSNEIPEVTTELLVPLNIAQITLSHKLLF